MTHPRFAHDWNDTDPAPPSTLPPARRASDSDAGIDLTQYGALLAQVAHLERQVNTLQRDVRSLLDLAQRSRGGFWAGMTIAAALGSIASALAGIGWGQR